MMRAIDYIGMIKEAVGPIRTMTLPAAVLSPTRDAHKLRGLRADKFALGGYLPPSEILKLLQKAQENKIAGSAQVLKWIGRLDPGWEQHGVLWLNPVVRNLSDRNALKRMILRHELTHYMRLKGYNPPGKIRAIPKLLWEETLANVQGTKALRKYMGNTLQSKLLSAGILAIGAPFSTLGALAPGLAQKLTRRQNEKLITLLRQVARMRG